MKEIIMQTKELTHFSQLVEEAEMTIEETYV